MSLVIVARDDVKAFVPVYVRQNSTCSIGYSWTPSTEHALKFETRDEAMTVFSNLIDLMEPDIHDFLKKGFPSGRGQLEIGSTEFVLTDCAVSIRVF